MPTPFCKCEDCHYLDYLPITHKYKNDYEIMCILIEMKKSVVIAYG